MNNNDELYGALRSIGLSEEYIEFINQHINEKTMVGEIVSSIVSGKITDVASFIDYFNKNIKISSNMNLFMQTNFQTVQFPDVIRASGIDAYSKIADAVAFADKIVSQAVEAHGLEGDNVIISNSSYEKAEQSGIIEDGHSENNSETKKPLSNNEVTQHTASLWKYQPVDNSQPENSSEYITEKLVSENAEIISASVRGKKHKHDGSNRDDCFKTAFCEDIAIMAVSDGAGSKKFSRIGASYACDESVKTAVKLINDLKKSEKFKLCMENISAPLSSQEFMSGCGIFANIIQESVISAYNTVEKAFNERKSKYEYLKVLERDMEFKDFSATLLIVIAVPVVVEGKIQTLVVSCQIGDGMIAAVSFDSDDAIKLLGEADSGSFAGETDFITSSSMKNKENLMGRTKIARKEISEILVMTDGVADDYYPNSSRMNELYMNLQLNGILPTKNDLIGDISEIPEPISYPWVNDNSIEISVNYCSEIIEKCGITAEFLWNNNGIISEAVKKLGDLEENSEERLKIWLDNYVERGSFDDRTLVIYSVINKEVLDNEQTG